MELCSRRDWVQLPSTTRKSSDTAKDPVRG